MPDRPLLPDDPTRVPDEGAPGGNASRGDAPEEATLGGAVRPGETREEAVSRLRWVKRGAWALGGLVGLVALLAVAAVVFLGTETGRQFLQRTAVTQIQNLLADDAELTVDRLEGNFLTGARLTGLVVRRDGEAVLSVDTVFVDYTLTTLLNRTFSADQVTISGARLVMRQREDGSFNVAGLLKPTERDTTKAGIAVRIANLALLRSRAEVHFWPPGGASGRGDSTLVLDSLTARVVDFATSRDSLSGSIEGLSTVATAPYDAARMRVRTAGRFSKSDLVLRGLSIEGSNGTRVAGRGRLLFRPGALPVFDAALEATPLALADVRAFAPVPVYGDPRLRLTADSNGRRLAVALLGSLGEAALSLDGELTRDTDGPLAYRAEGTLRRLDLGALTRNPALAGDLTGDLRLDLQGTEPRALSGAFAVALRESRFAGRTIDRLQLAGDVAAGRVAFDLDGRLPGLDLVAEGEARPFDDVPSVAVRGQARDVDLARLLPGTGQRGRLAGTVALVGRGTSVDDFTGTAAASLSRLEYPLPPAANGAARTLRLSSATLDADLDGGLVGYDLDATLAGGGGRLAAVGQVDTGGSVLRYTVDRGRLDGLNVAAITGDPAQASRLSGTFSLDGAGTDPASLSLDATAALAGSRFGRFDLDRATADVRLRSGTATVDVDADLGVAGGLTAVGTVRPFADPLAFDLRGTLRRLDLAALTGNPAQVSDLSGSYAAKGAGLDPATMALDARIQLENSRYGDYLVDATDLTATLRRGALTLAGSADTPDGRFVVDLSGRPFDASPSFAFGERTCFAGLNVGAFTGNASLNTDLDGCFSGRLAGLSNLPTANAEGVLTLRESTVNEAVVEAARVVFTLARGALGATIDVTLPAALPVDADGEPLEDADPLPGRVIAAVQARPFDTQPSYAVRGSTERLDLGPFLGYEADQPARFTLDFDVSGRGLDPATMTLVGSLNAGGGSTVGPVRVDSLDTAFALDGGILRVDRLTLDTDLADATGSGTIALFDASAASRFQLDGTVESLAPLAASLSQPLALESGTFSLTAVGKPDQPLGISGRLDADQIAYGETSISSIDGTLAVQVDRTRLDSLGVGAITGRVDGTFDALRRPGLTVQNGTLSATLAEGGDATIAGSVVVDGTRDIEFASRLNIDDDPLEVTVEAGRFGLDGTTWRLAQPTRIVVADGILIRGLLLQSDADGGQQILADGRLDFDGEQDLVVTADNVRLDAITDLVGFPDLGGRLSATLALSGPATAPLLDGTIELDDVTAKGNAVGTLDAEVGYADGRLTLDAILTHASGQTLVVDGVIPRRFALAEGAVQGEDAAADDEVEITARASAFPLDAIEPFLDERAYSEVAGTLRLDLTVTGTQADPQLDGVATVTGGRLGVVATGLTYPFEADVTFQGNRIALDDVRVVDARGETRLDVGGSVRLQELSLGELDLTVTPQGFTAMDTPTFRRLVLDAGAQPLRLTGPLTRPVLRGSVALTSGDIYVTDELVPPDIETVELTDAQLREVETRFGRTLTARDTAVSRFTDALDYDLTVSIRRNVWLRADAGLAYDIEFEGDVQAVKPAFSKESELFGQIEIVRGSVETLNRRFDVERGRLVFNGPALAANVDIGATLDVRLGGTIAGQSSVQITLGVTGQLNDNPEIRLSSNPAMDPADIISVIATGQLSDNLASGSGGSFGGLLTGALYGQLGGVLEGLASRNLGLDLAQIDVGEGGTLVIRVGKYLTNRLFLTGGYVVNPSSSASAREGQVPLELTLEYQLLRWLAAQGEFSGQRGIGGGLETEIAW